MKRAKIAQSLPARNRPSPSPAKLNGMKSVSDKLHVKESSKTSVKIYASDAAITSEVKAKFLADKSVPSRMIKVETTNGIIQLSGNVENAAQGDPCRKRCQRSG